ncbi:RNA 2',3'-cyclic phosphodiesterase [Bacillus infantis]|uniref:RNA 2',3'-cyclic phosphodiesterase n=1 Tax=Bacillus infantis TaxID=324767 RepID=UPI003CF52278
MQTHYFFAVRLPEDAKERLKLKCGAAAEMLEFQKWVHYLDYHITLAFLGNAGKDKLQHAAGLVGKALLEEEAFSLSTSKFGVFGKPEQPRIFWADTAAQPRLAEVRQKVFDACTEAGFQLELRPFKPHITLARRWAGSSPFDPALLENESLLTETISFPAAEVVLYQTHMDRSPKYEAIEVYTLK